MRSKSSSEILADATLTAYFSFDGGSYADSGPNNVNGTGSGLNSVTGKSNQAISFTTNSSYFQVILILIIKFFMLKVKTK